MIVVFVCLHQIPQDMHQIPSDSTRQHQACIRQHQICARHHKTPPDMTRHAPGTTRLHQTPPDMYQTPPDMHQTADTTRHEPTHQYESETYWNSEKISSPLEAEYQFVRMYLDLKRFVFCFPFQYLRQVKKAGGQWLGLKRLTWLSTKCRHLAPLKAHLHFASAANLDNQGPFPFSRYDPAWSRGGGRGGIGKRPFEDCSAPEYRIQARGQLV